MKTDAVLEVTVHNAYKKRRRLLTFRKYRIASALKSADRVGLGVKSRKEDDEKKKNLYGTNITG